MSIERAEWSGPRSCGTSKKYGIEYGADTCHGPCVGSVVGANSVAYVAMTYRTTVKVDATKSTWEPTIGRISSAANGDINEVCAFISPHKNGKVSQWEEGRRGMLTSARMMAMGPTRSAART